MRHKPKLPYCGLTIVLSNPSRFDSQKLLTGAAGHYVNDKCLRPEFNRLQCDIRTSDTRDEGLLPNTKCVLLLGERAFHEWTGKSYDNYRLHEQRGYLLNPRATSGPFVIASYSPQDCMDIKNYEEDLNNQYKEWSSDGEGENDEGEDDIEIIEQKKRKGVTKRKNYRFWLMRDIQKCKKLILLENPTEAESIAGSRFTYNIYPPSNEIITKLTTTKGQHFYFDIETDNDRNITCFSYSFGNSIVTTVPVIRYDYSKAYGNLPGIFRALAISLRDNTVVIHNSMFDLFVLLEHYNLPIGKKVYDTMLAHHRCWPEVEKSLGHAISHLTLWERYHKDEGIFQPWNTVQERQLWEYNAKDVSSLILIKEAMDELAAKVPGLRESIAQANSLPYSYLINTLVGINFSEEERRKRIDKNDRLMRQYLIVLAKLVGYAFLPTSPKQCNEYFHIAMGYKIAVRGDKGQASWNEHAMRKLKLKHPDNIVIDFCLAYRSLSKETGTLKFKEWKKE